ncbi:MAG TPA: hypothetical protein DHV48_10825 [Prolixibacteraceae bacterium]|nr:hypothetical protein [Prolixibacteraceae bacterium]
MLFEFEDSQFNRIFPFYVLIGEDLKIISIGKTLTKVHPDFTGKYFAEAFQVKRPQIVVTDIKSLSDVIDQLVVLECIGSKISLRGQFEFNERSAQVLFIGSPWFGSMGQVVENNLKIKDFAFHDPLIDLLHVLKTQEISNDELKQLVNSFNRQKEELKKANKEIQDIALFPTQNPDPLIRVDRSGNILRLNPSAEKLNEFTFNHITYNRADFWKQLSASLDPNSEREVYEAESGGKVYSFVVKSIPDFGYYNIYGRDITKQKQDEERLIILSSIAAKNTHGVVIANNQGVVEWVNESFEKMSGYAAHELINLKPGKFLQGKDTDPETIRYISQQVRAGEPFRCEILNYNKIGTPYWVRILGQALKDEQGNVFKYFAIQEDVTEKKKTEEQLRQIETKFRVALEKIGDNVWEHDFKTGKTYFSKKINEFLGVDSQNAQLNDKLWWLSIHKEDLPLLIENDRRCRSGEIDSHSLEYRVVSADGTIRWVLDRGVVTEKDENGYPVRLIGTHTDITRIKETEMELATSLKQFKSLSENIPGVIYEYEFRKDGTEGFRYISSAIERIFGISSEEFFNFQKYIHEDDLPRIFEKNQKSKETLEPFYIEARLMIPGKGEVWHSVSSSFSYYSQEGAAVFIGFMLDINDRKKFEETLKANEEKFRNILANMNIGLIEVDKERKITYANKRFAEMINMPEDQIYGVDTLLYLAPQSRDLVDAKFPERQKGKSEGYEIQVNINGKKEWWFVSVAPKIDISGNFSGSTVICLDVSDRKDLEQQLIVAREKAEQLGKTKEIFLANMSHEIRTPMNAIIGMGNQLAKTELKGDQQMFLKTIQSAADNLLIIINDILDFSKIEAGRLELEYIGFEPREVVGQILRVMTYKAEEKGILLTNSLYDKRLASVLKGDPYRINQVLLNLVSNSIKFTEKGSVDILCEVIEDKPDSQKLRITVEDTGVGMDESFVNKIFEKFTQEYKSGSRRYGGTGLGMSISKDLIELMGGTIEVISQKGIGTKVFLTLELEKGVQSDLQDKNHVEIQNDFLKGKRIIVADDNDNNRLVASFILQNYGAEILEAGDGKKVVDLLMEADADLILMDIQMPVMNGIDATGWIRKSGNTIPIIALTANAIKGENEKCIAAGMNDYISKPFKEEDFLNTIAIWMNKSKNKVIESVTEPSKLVSTQKLYDLEKIIPFSRGNESFLKKMIKVFCDQTPAEVDEMVAAFNAQQFEKMGAIAHKIKPNIDNFNILLLAEDIRLVEKARKEKVDFQQLETAIENIKRVTSEVIESMKADYPE